MTAAIIVFTLFSLFSLKHIHSLEISRTWSNRLGAALTPISTGVWAAERPFYWNSIDVGGRSLICRSSDGNLLVHSPVELDSQLEDAIAKLGGDVAYLIAPNYEHLKYVSNWTAKYPKVKAFGCPGLATRMPEINWTFEFGADNFDSFDDNVEWLWMDCETNPFSGKPFFNEVVFLHKPSRTFFCADAFWNYPSSESVNFCGITGTGNLHKCSKISIGNEVDYLPNIPVPFSTRMWKFGMDKIYLPFYKNLMVKPRRKKYLELVDKVLSWEIETIAPCHGDIINGKDLCATVLKKHFL